MTDLFAIEAEKRLECIETRIHDLTTQMNELGAHLETYLLQSEALKQYLRANPPSVNDTSNDQGQGKRRGRGGPLGYLNEGSVSHTVFNLLSEYESPLSIKEILTLMGRPIDRKSIMAVSASLAKSHHFVRVKRGIWGLAKWGKNVQ